MQTHTGEPSPDPILDRKAFEEADNRAWQEVFFDSCTGDWTEKWFLDGEIAAASSGREGMRLTAGPQFGNNAHHMVLWIKDVFEGDLKIEYEYTRLDFEKRCVNILYVQATGSGQGPYKTDIAEWNELRRIPAMGMYFNHMDTYHISYAAYPNEEDESDDYVRARRYMPEKQGLEGTDLAPDYFRSGLFKPGVPHRFTVIKRINNLMMRVSNDEKTSYFHWHNDKLPPIEAGRIGLRHMFTRSARYKNFRVSVPQQG
jgi:hypothetical protein